MITKTKSKRVCWERTASLAASMSKETGRKKGRERAAGVKEKKNWKPSRKRW